MAIDDHRIDAMPRKLVGEHQAGGTGTDDQHVALLGKGWHEERGEYSEARIMLAMSLNARTTPRQRCFRKPI